MKKQEKPLKKPRLTFEWKGPYSKHDTQSGWVIEGAKGLILLDRLTKYEAEVLVYAFNKAYPVDKDGK